VDWDTAVAGQTADDFLVFAASGNLFRRVQGTWVKEGLPAPTASDKGGELVSATNGTLYAFRDTAGPIFKLAAGASCWESISDSLYSTGIPLDNQTLGYLSTSQWCEVPLP
jgi:hypothetical protein